MARTPNGNRMRAFSQPFTVSSPIHPLHSIPASAVAVNASSFAGEPLTTRLSIPQSSSSASDQLSLPQTSDVAVIEPCATRANQRVLGRPISAILPSLDTTLESVPYDHGSSVPVHLSSSQSRSWLTVPLCRNVYPYRLFDHTTLPAVEQRFGFPLHRVKPNYQPHEKCRPVPHWTTAVILAPTTTM